MKKYLLTGGIASVLLLSACGTDDSQENNEPDANDNSAEIEQLENENKELQVQVEELEDQLEEQEEYFESEDDMDSNEDSVSEESDAGTRTEPLNLGDTGTISILTYSDSGDMEEITGTADITVDNVVRGQEAEEILTTEYSEPDDAPYNLEWVVFDASIALNELSDDNEEITFSDDFEVITEDGSTIEKVFTTYDDEFGIQGVYTGGTAEGKIAAHAPEGESFIINYDDYMRAEAYFQVD